MSAIDKTPYDLNFSVMKEEQGGFDVEGAIRGMDVAGAIVSTVLGVFDVSTKNIFDLSVPAIILNQYRAEENPGCFLVDNSKSAYDATIYLISRGHRRIGFVRGPSAFKDAQDRYTGYIKALNDNGITHDAGLEYQSDFLEESGCKAVRYYFSGEIEAPSAIFFSTDAIAMTAINELRHIGISCPEKVSIIGFDGIDAGRYTDPPLTTVLQPIYEMAHEAVRQIIRNVDGGNKFNGTRYFTAKIIERGSVLPLDTLKE